MENGEKQMQTENMKNTASVKLTR